MGDDNSKEDSWKTEDNKKDSSEEKRTYTFDEYKSFAAGDEKKALRMWNESKPAAEDDSWKKEDPKQDDSWKKEEQKQDDSWKKEEHKQNTSNRQRKESLHLR